MKARTRDFSWTLISPYPTLLSISYIGCEQAKCLQFFRRMVGTEMGWNFGVE